MKAIKNEELHKSLTATEECLYTLRRRVTEEQTPMVDDMLATLRIIEEESN